MTEATKQRVALDARKAYNQAYRKKNKERLNEYRKQWAKDNPEKVKQYQLDYWARKAQLQKIK